jgi:hypothetical protein
VRRRVLPAGLRCLLPVLALCWLPLPALGQVPYLVEDIAPGVDATIGLDANQFLALARGTVLFANRSEVWATDGTPAGTERLAVLYCQDCNGVAFVATLGATAFFSPSSGTADPLLKSAGANAYFVADDLASAADTSAF